MGVGFQVWRALECFLGLPPVEIHDFDNLEMRSTDLVVDLIRGITR